MLDGVADCFADDGFGMIGQRGINDRKRAHELHAGTSFGTRKLGDLLVQPVRSRVVPAEALQGKSDGEEPLDDVVVEVPRDPVAVRCRRRARRIRRCALANCQASAAWSAKAAIMSSQRCNLFCQWSSPVGGRLAVNR